MNLFDLLHNEEIQSRNKNGTYGSLNQSIDKLDKKTIWGLNHDEDNICNEIITNDKNRLIGIFEKPKNKQQNEFGTNINYQVNQLVQIM